MSAWGGIRPQDDEQPRLEAAWRTDFNVDADRVLYSPEWRRLAGVTQVISPQDDYVFHDRLTHSLKVAQVAQRLAQELLYRHSHEWDAGVLSGVLEPEICYVAGLSHDLGHPPFGHAAETQLQEMLAPTAGDELLPDSFEGNAQSFRIAARLSFRKQVDDTTLAGLNLTWRSLAAISKYPWPRGEHPPDQTKLDKKWGFYNTERQFFEHMRDTGLIHPYGSESSIKQNLEAQVMDWADDVAYAVHDLEDFFRAGRVPLDRLSRSGNNAGDSGSPDSPDAEWEELMTFALLKQQYLRERGEAVSEDELRKLAAEVRETLPSLPFSGSKESHINLLGFSSQTIRTLSDGCRIVAESVTGRPLLEITPLARSTAEFLKSVTQFFVINDPTVETMQVGQRRVVEELFNALHALAIRVTSKSKSEPVFMRNLPARLAQYCEEVLSNDEYAVYGNAKARLARAVVDFLCSLTDKQAALLHQRMTGDTVGRLSPGWLNV